MNRPAAKPLGIQQQLQVHVSYQHMRDVTLVMLDRAIWFAKVFEALASDDPEVIRTHFPDLNGPPASANESLSYALAYAQKVFLCTAVEESLLQHYINAMAVAMNLGRVRPQDLTVLQRWIDARRGGPKWDGWREMPADQRLQTLKQMSFANLDRASRFFNEIYGDQCLQMALGGDRHNQFAEEYDALQLQRNGIVHRGGEFIDGTKIAATPETITSDLAMGFRFRDSLLAFQDWGRDRLLRGCSERL